MSIPEVSVVMSVYNNADDLDSSVNSILSQDEVDFEFIIVDDGSTDGSAEILDTFAAGDSRIRVIHQTNTGLTKALIRGCAEARGEFIARQDADDISLPGRLLAQLKVFGVHQDVVMVSSWSACDGPNGEELFVNRPEDDMDASTGKLLNGKQGPSAHGSVMFRRNAYVQAGGYRHEFYCAQDNDLWLRIGYLGKYCVIPEVLYRYRVCPKSISGAKRGLAGEYDRLAHACHRTRLRGEDEAPLLLEASQLKQSKPAFTDTASSQVMTYFIGRCLLMKRDLRASDYFLSVIRKSPLHVRAWASLIQLAIRRARIWPGN